MVPTRASPPPRRGRPAVADPAPAPAPLPALCTVLALLLLVALSSPGAVAQADPVAGGGRWQWPLAPPHRVVAPFAAPPNPYAAGHRGLDIVGGGPEVRAVERGTVRFAGPVAGRGVVSVLHADGLLSTYEPVTASVSAGDPVGAGTALGTLETAGSHCAGEPCLHLGARRGESYQDPLPLLGVRGPSVLVPLAGTSGGSPGGRPGAGSGAGLSADGGLDQQAQASHATSERTSGASGRPTRGNRAVAAF